MSQYLSTNGYTYEKNKDGSYSRSGTARPSGMSASDQYHAANSGAFSSYSRNSSGEVSLFAGSYGRFSVSSDRANLFGDGSSSGSKPVKPVKSAGTGAGAGSVSTGKAAASSTGPGNPGVSAPGVRVPGPGGSSLQLPLGKLSGVTPLVAGGHLVPIDQGWSDAQLGEQRWGESEFLSPSWFYAWGVAGADVWKGFTGFLADADRRGRASLASQGDGAWPDIESWAVSHLKPGRVGSDGNIYVTGGGF